MNQGKKEDSEHSGCFLFAAPLVRKDEEEKEEKEEAKEGEKT